MLTPEQMAGLREKAVAVYSKNVATLKNAGFVLEETDSRRVRATIVIGGETLQPHPPFPKANLADLNWTPRFLRNQDAFITKAQVVAIVEDAVADLPL